MTVKITQTTRGTPRKSRRGRVAFHGWPARRLEAHWLFHLGTARRRRRYNVTFPARQYTVNGERRSFALLRPIGDTTAQNKVRELILQAYQEYEERSAIAS